MGDAHLPLGPLAEIDVAEIDEGRIERHVTADVPRHAQLHLGEERLVEGDGERGPVLAEERLGVEGRHDLGGRVGLEVHLGDRRGGAPAAGAHADDMEVFLVLVAEHEPVLRLRAAGDVAEVVARLREHLLGPILGPGRCRTEQQEPDDNDQRETELAEEGPSGAHGRVTKGCAAGGRLGRERPYEEYGCHGRGVNGALGGLGGQRCPSPPKHSPPGRPRGVSRRVSP